MSNFLPSLVMVLALLMIGFCIVAISVEGIAFTFGVVAIFAFLVIGYVASSSIKK